jgi:von Willebrand factor type A domain
MKKTTRAALLIAAVLGPGGTVRASVSPPCRPHRQALALDQAPVVQLAILLDTSNSMDGLIDQARTQLWTIVNQFSAARRHGRPARLQVALYEYGNSRLPTAGGYLRRVLPFTTDLDRVSEELFALTTNGGDEYCGTVMQAALDQLAWSSSPADLKVIFIAGNEPFTQGPIDFRRVCQRAARAGVTVNTIHCGSRAEGQNTGWAEGARLAYGSFSSIDQAQVAEHIEAPQDGEISRLGVKLNETYLPYGAAGRDGQQRQATQDKNAQGAGAASATSRAVTKANRLYSNAGWDLVDAVKDGGVDLHKLKADDLPPSLQGLTPEELQAEILARAQERERLQREINCLNVERQQHVAAERRKRGKGPAVETLDVAMMDALRQQAACREIELQ